MEEVRWGHTACAGLAPAQIPALWLPSTAIQLPESTLNGLPTTIHHRPQQACLEDCAALLSVLEQLRLGLGVLQA